LYIDLILSMTLRGVTELWTLRFKFSSNSNTQFKLKNEKN